MDKLYRAVTAYHQTFGSPFTRGRPAAGPAQIFDCSVEVEVEGGSVKKVEDSKITCNPRGAFIPTDAQFKTFQGLYARATPLNGPTDDPNFIELAKQVVLDKPFDEIVTQIIQNSATKAEFNSAIKVLETVLSEASLSGADEALYDHVYLQTSDGSFFGVNKDNQATLETKENAKIITIQRNKPLDPAKPFTTNSQTWRADILFKSDNTTEYLSCESANVAFTKCVVGEKPMNFSFTPDAALGPNSYLFTIKIYNPDAQFHDKQLGTINGKTIHVAQNWADKKYKWKINKHS